MCELAISRVISRKEVTYFDRLPLLQLRDKTLVNRWEQLQAFLGAYSSLIASHKALGLRLFSDVKDRSWLLASNFIAINPDAFFCQRSQLADSFAVVVGLASVPSTIPFRL